jgi:hypothetical protein
MPKRKNRTRGGQTEVDARVFQRQTYELVVHWKKSERHRTDV